jgi:Bacterial Ig-like domain (group 3)
MQKTANRAHWLAGASFLFVGLAIANWPAHAIDSTGVRAVPTYEAAGLYWSNPGATAATGCQVQFRKQGDANWTQGLAMWFDARNSECRGSIVGLTNGTAYEAQMNLPGQAAAKSITFTTWSNAKPVASTVKVASGSATLNITQGGSASGYVVYDGTGATLDAANGSQYNITVNASYVIVRGFALKGAQVDAIRISPNVSDVIIEDNDISGWGRTRDGTWGTDMDSAVRAVCSSETLTRVTIQRNKMHDPRYSANSWSDGHPAGPQGITFSYCAGNHVFRWNEIDGGAKHFNDGMGGEDNFSTTGFPNRDSDIYGNTIQNTWDDGIESEGGNNNVRIWGNYINNTATGIATTATSVGPVYIFRNVFNRNKFYEKVACDGDDRQPFFKSGSDSSLGDGRRYIFHNTMLQAQQSGCSYGLGGGAGIGGTGSAQLINNTFSMNNIYHLWKPNSAFYQVGVGNLFQNDMFNGSAGASEINGINATPSYAAGNGWSSESSGAYALASGTPGYDTAVRIPNFNDAFVGAGPDVGAAEAGAGAMKFGIAAADAIPVPATTPATAPASEPLLNPVARPTVRRTLRAQTTGSAVAAVPTTTANTGSAPISLTLDSSSYTTSVGQGVTFTVRLLGNDATPTGTVAFKAGTNVISDCSSVAVSNGQAACTTATLAAGSYQISGAYSGDSIYSAGIAGPITQTVR